jgi:hypothetical protein
MAIESCQTQSPFILKSSGHFIKNILTIGNIALSQRSLVIYVSMGYSRSPRSQERIG